MRERSARGSSAPRRRDHRATLARRAFGAAAGIVADRLLGEPPVPGHLHPVAVFGTAASRLERGVYADSRANGALFAGAGLAAAAGVGRLLGSSTAATYLASSGRALHDAALDVAGALDRDDLDRARALLPHLVGRDPADLDAKDIARATVESVAENTTDAVVAPAVWTLLLGPAGALAHRAADTLDSMVGYRNVRYERFGTAAARLDDVLAWLPARVTAGLVALTRPRWAGDVWAVVTTDGPRHPSPNAGIGEAAFAAALGLQLGGTNRYGDRVEDRPVMGTGRPAEPGDIVRAVTLSRDVSWALTGILASIGTAGLLSHARTRRRHRHE